MAGQHRDAYLDGLRAVAIGSVLALHWVSWYVPFFHGGSVGVDVFFVLSGFIITSVLWRGRRSERAASGLWPGWVDFIRRRVLRLYPALLGLVAGTVLLYAVIPFAPLSVAEVARRGTLVLGQTTSFWGASETGGLWVPALHPFGHAWSLAIEWYFYLLWPLVVLAARARAADPFRLALGSAIAAVGWYVVALPLSSQWFYFSPPARFGEILAGAALAFAMQARGLRAEKPRWLPVAQACALAALAAYVLFAPAGGTTAYRFVGVPLATVATVVLILAGYDAPGTLVHRFLAHRAVAAIGRYSYSLYLWHLIPMLLLADAPLPKPVLAGISVTMTLVLTVLSYRLLERPFLRPRSDALRPAHAVEPATEPLAAAAG